MKKIQILLVMVLLSVLLAGCGGSDTTASKASQSSSAPSSEAFPITVTDATNKEITISKKPERIVSLMPSNTEIAYALGLEEQIVGVSDWDNYPEDTLNKEKIGGLEINVEKVISLKPDLVLAHGSSISSSKGAITQIENAGIQVLVVNDAKTFADVYQSIELLGSATGTTASATEIIDGMKGKLVNIEEKAQTIPKDQMKTVWIEVAPAPEIYTTGTGTFIDEMLQTIGAKNAVTDQAGWVQFTEEDAVLLQPDVIITTYGYYVDKPTEQVMARKAWQDVPAVKNGAVYDVNADAVTRPGPRLIEGIEALAKKVYPDVF